MKLVVAFALVAVIAYVSAAPAGDEVASLPGFDKPLLSRMYSGYLDAGFTQQLHYIFFESENEPSTDPVLLWTNGGPGCSSMDGLTREMGPYHFVESPYHAPAPGLPQMMVNPFRWTKNYNMIFLESPAGVGYSYAANGNTTTNDVWQSERMLSALDDFFNKKFPEFKKNDFYATGESYSGIYTPQIAKQILAHPEVGINLKGIAVGDGCYGNSVGSCSAAGTKYNVEYLHDHFMYDPELYKQILQACQFDSLKRTEDASEDCNALLDKMSGEIGNINIYDIYKPCPASMYEMLDNMEDDERKQFIADNEIRRTPETPLTASLRRVNGLVGCVGGAVMGAYFNNVTVRAALHVKSEGEIGRWTVCSAIPYTSNVVTEVPLYQELFQKIKVLIYEGLADACIPATNDPDELNAIGAQVRRAWEPWYVTENDAVRVAGYVKRFEKQSAYASILASGHMVPQYQPAAASVMIDAFINDKL